MLSIVHMMLVCCSFRTLLSAGWQRAVRGFNLCPPALEDYNELFVTLTGDNGCGVVTIANDELAAASTSGPAWRALPHRNSSIPTYHVLRHPTRSSCGFETPALCRRCVLCMTHVTFF